MTGLLRFQLDGVETGSDGVEAARARWLDLIREENASIGCRRRQPSRFQEHLVDCCCGVPVQLNGEDVVRTHSPMQMELESFVRARSRLLAEAWQAASDATKG